MEKGYKVDKPGIYFLRIARIGYICETYNSEPEENYRLQTFNSCRLVYQKEGKYNGDKFYPFFF